MNCRGKGTCAGRLTQQHLPFAHCPARICSAALHVQYISTNGRPSPQTVRVTNGGSALWPSARYRSPVAGPYGALDPVRVRAILAWAAGHRTSGHRFSLAARAEAEHRQPIGRRRQGPAQLRCTPVRRGARAAPDLLAASELEAAIGGPAGLVGALDVFSLSPVAPLLVTGARVSPWWSCVARCRVTGGRFDLVACFVGGTVRRRPCIQYSAAGDCVGDQPPNFLHATCHMSLQPSNYELKFHFWTEDTKQE